MSRRACELALAAALVAGCGPAPVAVDVCAADAALAAALVGGQLHVEVRAADGTPRAAGSAAVDHASRLALGRASDGEWIVVEADDAGAQPVAVGAAQLQGNAACVCLSRSRWYAFATWQDKSGVYHDGRPTEFFVRRSRAPGVEPVRPLALDRARVQPGDVLRATTAYQSDAGAAVDVRAIEVLARPPGATHGSGLAGGFSAITVGTVAPGAVVNVDATRRFAASDASGDWALFTRLTDRLGLVHDGPETGFTVGGSDSDPLIATAPPGLDHAWVRPPDMLHVTTSYRNPTAAPLTIQTLVETVRPPGGSNVGGPFDDLSPRLAVTTIGPGQTLDVAADRSFPAAEDPCAGMVCAVAGGLCQLRISP